MSHSFYDGVFDNLQKVVDVSNFISVLEFRFKMPGILDNLNCADCIEGDRRNSIAAAVAGALVRKK